MLPILFGASDVTAAFSQEIIRNVAGADANTSKRSSALPSFSGEALKNLRPGGVRVKDLSGGGVTDYEKTCQARNDEAFFVPWHGNEAWFCR
jgi:hypothetical protein